MVISSVHAKYEDGDCIIPGYYGKREIDMLDGWNYQESGGSAFHYKEGSK